VEGSSCGLVLRYFPSICLEGLKKTTESLNRASQSPSPDLNPGPHCIVMIGARYRVAHEMSYHLFNI
jgi:hypothetical protein